MGNYTISITFNDKQQKVYREWQEHIKAIHGLYGNYSYTVWSDGIGQFIEVYSHLTKTTLDLTDIDNF